MKDTTFNITNDSVLTTSYDHSGDASSSPSAVDDATNNINGNATNNVKLPPQQQQQQQLQRTPSSISYHDDNEIDHPSGGGGIGGGGAPPSSPDRRASEEMANYLDHVESSDVVHDICSFQDVDLNATTNGRDEENQGGGGGGNNNNNNHDGTNSEGGYARARKRYYLLPMLIRYHLPILGCTLIFGMFLVAISLSASMAQQQKQQQQQQELQQSGGAGYNGNGNYGGGDIIINDAPPTTSIDLDNGGNSHLDDKSTIHSPQQPPSSSSSGSGSAGSGSGSGYQYEDETSGEGEEILGVSKEETYQPTERLTRRPTRSPTIVTPNVDSDSNSSGSGATATTTTTSDDAGNPQWFTTSHPDYQSILLNHPIDFSSSSSTSSTNNNNNNHTPIQQAHINAKNFCLAQNLNLCAYHHYCPNGPSTAPYNDEGSIGWSEKHPSQIFSWNSLEWEQWAPLASSKETNDMGNGWVQVGRIPSSEGGGDDGSGGGGDGGRCWIYADWVNGGVHGFSEPEGVGVGNLRWILCCPSANSSSGGGGDSSSSSSSSSGSSGGTGGGNSGVSDASGETTGDSGGV